MASYNNWEKTHNLVSRRKKWICQTCGWQIPLVDGRGMEIGAKRAMVDHKWYNRKNGYICLGHIHVVAKESSERLPTKNKQIFKGLTFLEKVKGDPQLIHKQQETEVKEEKEKILVCITPQQTLAQKVLSYVNGLIHKCA